MFRRILSPKSNLVNSCTRSSAIPHSLLLSTQVVSADLYYIPFYPRGSFKIVVSRDRTGLVGLTCLESRLSIPLPATWAGDLASLRTLLNIASLYISHAQF